MRLTEQQRIEVQSRLERLWRNGSCDFCGGSCLTIAVDVMELRSFHEGILMEGGAVTPVVPVSCATCGATRLFNAIMLGLIDPDSGKRRINT